jgi:hypothetical protein
MVKRWDKFDEVKMAIVVRHIKGQVVRFRSGPWLTFDVALLYLMTCWTLESVGECQLEPVFKRRLKQAKVCVPWDAKI